MAPLRVLTTSAALGLLIVILRAGAALAGEYTIGSVVLTGSLENAFNDQTQEINGYRPRGRTITVGGRVSVGR